MSETERPARPRQLIMAGGFVIGGSVFLVLSVFDSITGLRSVEMRDEITRVLSSPTGKGLGISVSQATELMRVGLMVAGACAAATAVLGFYVFQRSRPARLALTVLAVPILLTSPMTGGLVGLLVVLAISMLWSGPVRDWFDGRPIRQPEPRPAPRPDPPAGPTFDNRAQGGPGHSGQGQGTGSYPEQPSGHASGHSSGPVAPASSLTAVVSSDQPQPTSGFGDPVAAPPGVPGPSAGPSSYADRGRRSAPPVTVKVACILTWVFAGMVSLLYLAMTAALIVSQDQLVDLVVETPEWKRAELDSDMVLPLMWVGCLIFLAWSLGACVLAWFTWRRHNWARWLLVVSAAATLAIAFVAFPVGIPYQFAAALTIGGLVGTAAQKWFAGHEPTGPSGPPAPGWPEGQHPGPYAGQQGQYPGQQGPPQGQYPGQQGQQGQYPGQQGQPQGQGAPHGQQGPDQQPPPSGKPPVW